MSAEEARWAADGLAPGTLVLVAFAAGQPELHGCRAKLMRRRGAGKWQLRVESDFDNYHDGDKVTEGASRVVEDSGPCRPAPSSPPGLRWHMSPGNKSGHALPGLPFSVNHADRVHHSIPSPLLSAVSHQRTP